MDFGLRNNPPLGKRTSGRKSKPDTTHPSAPLCKGGWRRSRLGDCRMHSSSGGLFHISHWPSQDNPSGPAKAVPPPFTQGRQGLDFGLRNNPPLGKRTSGRKSKPDLTHPSAPLCKGGWRRSRLGDCRMHSSGGGLFHISHWTSQGNPSGPAKAVPPPFTQGRQGLDWGLQDTQPSLL